MSNTQICEKKEYCRRLALRNGREKGGTGDSERQTPTGHSNTSARFVCHRRHMQRLPEHGRQPG